MGHTLTIDRYNGGIATCGRKRPNLADVTRNCAAANPDSSADDQKLNERYVTDIRNHSYFTNVHLPDSVHIQEPLSLPEYV